jgi:hypothetical protein
MILPVGEFRFGIVASDEILSLLALFFSIDNDDQEPAAYQCSIGSCENNLFTVEIGGVAKFTKIPRAQILSAVVECLITAYRRFGSQTVVRAAAVVWQNQPILITGGDHSGKSSLAAWLVKCGFAHQADQYVLIDHKTKRATGILTPLALKFPSVRTIVSWPDFRELPSVESEQGFYIRSNPEWRPFETSLIVSMVIDLDYVEGSSMSIAPIAPSTNTLESSNSDTSTAVANPGSLGNVHDILADVPSLKLQYGSFDQLDGKLELLIQMALELELDNEAFSKFIA